MSHHQQQILILHGLGRSPRSMQKIEKALYKQDYRILNVGYSALTGTFEQVINQILEKIDQWIEPKQTLHLVGHSFGGILIRGILANRKDWLFGRCVMIGSPNQGTAVASYALSHKVLRHLTPPITQELTPDSELMKLLPEPEIETGIIAGSKPYNLVIPVTWFYKKATNNAPGDGVVEISNTQCRNMSDFIVMPLHHSFMMWDSELIDQISHFLKNGCFIHLGKL